MIQQDYQGPAQKIDVKGAYHEVAGVNIYKNHADIRIIIYQDAKKDTILFERNYHINANNAEKDQFNKYFSKDALKAKDRDPFMNAEDWLIENKSEYKNAKKIVEPVQTTITK
jgi:hypothetical protein